ncbi:MAG: hypothetical protein NZ455_00270 [Bacteroidia bacterium]|nr:hypothetical protein [Bacteroidia bacterium]MDW8347346.1 hypothetical protein [Bacteroidia bacterium]
MLTCTHRNTLHDFVFYLISACFTRLIYLTFSINYDEWYYLAAWTGIKNGATLYQTILDNKPPLAYFLYAIPDIISPFFTLILISCIVSFYIHKITHYRSAGIIFLLVTAASPSYLELNLEYWVLLCMLPAYYWIFEKKNITWYKGAYLLCGASLMIKQHTLLLVIPLLAYSIFLYPTHFWRSVYPIFILPIICLIYVIYTQTLREAYDWIIGYNLWYRNLSETGSYIWKRFVYGQFFVLPLYIGLFLSLSKVKNNIKQITLWAAFILSLSSAWIGKELYLHYQLLTIPFLILLFFEVVSQRVKIIAVFACSGLFLFGQISYLYTYFTGESTWIKKLEGVLSYQEQKSIPSFCGDNPIIFSAESNLGLNYRNVKYIAVCSCLEYLKRKNPHQERLLTDKFYIHKAVYVVSKSCLQSYVRGIKYRVIFEYQDNVGIEIESGI